MSHAVFQTAQIMPVAPITKTLSSKPLLPAGLHWSPVAPPIAGKLRKSSVTTKASYAVVDGDVIAGLERCFQASPAADFPSTSPLGYVDFGPVMKGGQYGAFGAVTLEKSKLDLTQKQTKSSPEVFYVHILIMLVVKN